MKTRLIKLCKMELNKVVHRGNPHTPFPPGVMQKELGQGKRPQKVPTGGSVVHKIVITCYCRLGKKSP